MRKTFISVEVKEKYIEPYVLVIDREDVERIHLYNGKPLLRLCGVDDPFILTEGGIVQILVALGLRARPQMKTEEGLEYYSEDGLYLDSCMGNEYDWEQTMLNLEDILEIYVDIGAPGRFAAGQIKNLQIRYLSGERTDDLYDEIVEIITTV